MKSTIRLILTIFTLSILLNCRKDDANFGNTFEKLATILNVTSGAAKIFQDTFYTFNDTLRALHAVGNFLDDHEAVESAFYITSQLIDINFINGLSSSINLIEVDENGNHVTRGGQTTGVLKRFSLSGSTTSIKNAKVLVLNPYLNYFSYPGSSYDSYLPFFEGGDVVLDVTHIDNKNVRLSDINSMDEYGLVILNTHGKPNAFSFFDAATQSNPWLEEWTSALVEDMILQSENLPTSLFENGDLELGTSFLIKSNEASIDLSISIEVTDDYIRNSNLNLKDVIVFGNHCYSGFSHPFMAGDNMVEAWQSKNVATYYGYAFDNLISIPVNNDFCVQVEGTLIKRLAQKNDTTGIAHLSATDMLQSYNILVRPNIVGLDVSIYDDYYRFSRAVRRAGGDTPIPFYFKKFFSGNYLWGCTDSLLDERDMQVYRTVCVGDQIWMAENLNYASPNSLCFENDPNLCNQFGRLYNRVDLFAGQTPVDRHAAIGIRGICPQDWHLPSHQEWMDLEKAFGMPIAELDIIEGAGASNRGASANVGTKLKSTENWATPPIPNITNSSNVALKAGGIAFYTGQTFNGTGLFGRFWTSSYGELTTNNQPVIERVVYDSQAGVTSGQVPFIDGNLESGYYSCRCVKD